MHKNMAAIAVGVIWIYALRLLNMAKPLNYSLLEECKENPEEAPPTRFETQRWLR
jgi:hypothetical protein